MATLLMALALARQWRSLRRCLLAAHRAGQVPVALGRCSDFFGPWVLESGFGDRVLRPALAGKVASSGGKLDVSHTATYIADFGRALVILGGREEAPGQAWHVPNDRLRITQRQFAEIVYRESGHPVKASGVSRTVMRLAGLVTPAHARRWRGCTSSRDPSSWTRAGASGHSASRPRPSKRRSERR